MTYICNGILFTFLWRYLAATPAVDYSIFGIVYPKDRMDMACFNWSVKFHVPNVNRAKYSFLGNRH